MRELELLAPARNIEIGIAAIDCGADAVYLAGPSFGARQAAGNSIEDIEKLCRYAHNFGARVFVTLNTIIFDSELEQAHELALQLQKVGVDALIVQDFALASFELGLQSGHDGAQNGIWGSVDRGRLKLPLHASTQCSIRTIEEAKRFDALGFSRIVLERELPLSTVRDICSAVSCEVEAFVHGALCVCYSGQCYLSEMLSGRSANRGECVQACRSRYDLVDSEGELLRYPLSGKEGKHSAGRKAGRALAENRTLLSLRDLKLLERLPEMAEAGVCSFKIEGRLKSISYVRNIVATYSQALDSLVSRNHEKYRRASSGHSACAFTPSPDKSFNRGFTELFFDGRRGSWACLDAGKALGEEVGIVDAVSRTRDGFCITVRPISQSDENKFSQSRAKGGSPKNVKFPMSTDKGNSPKGNRLTVFHNGDGFSYIGRDGKEHGFRADVCNGNTILCRNADSLSPGVLLHRNLDTAFEKALEQGAVRRIGVKLRLEICGQSVENSGQGSGAQDCEGYKLSVVALSEDGRELKQESLIEAEAARNAERMLSMISGQLGKDTGIYSFTVTEIRHGADIPMMSAAQLNAIRRSLAERFDGTPCISRPLNHTQIKDNLPMELKFPEQISYKNDVTNSLAAELYHRLGAKQVEPAYESQNRGLKVKECDNSKTSGEGGIELMRSKYCLLHELGFCRKTAAYTELSATNNLSEGIFIRNNGRMLRLGFDCKNCEMTVCARE